MWYSWLPLTPRTLCHTTQRISWTAWSAGIHKMCTCSIWYRGLGTRIGACSMHHVLHLCMHVFWSIRHIITMSCDTSLSTYDRYCNVCYADVHMFVCQQAMFDIRYFIDDPRPFFRFCKVRGTLQCCRVLSTLSPSLTARRYIQASSLLAPVTTSLQVFKMNGCVHVMLYLKWSPSTGATRKAVEALHTEHWHSRARGWHHQSSLLPW